MELLFLQSRNKDDPEVARMKEQAKMVSACVFSSAVCLSTSDCDSVYSTQCWEWNL